MMTGRGGDALHGVAQRAGAVCAIEAALAEVRRARLVLGCAPIADCAGAHAVRDELRTAEVALTVASHAVSRLGERRLEVPVGEAYPDLPSSGGRRGD